MTAATTDAGRASTPWHVWVVGLIGLAWNGFGAFDYTMTQVQGDAWLRTAGQTDAQIAAFHALPMWMTADWAVGVWFSLLGSVLILARSKWATLSFFVSFLGVLGMLVYNTFLAKGAVATDPMMSIVITGACFLFLLYSHVMTKRGVLR
jgi:hypothetical protein